MNVSLSQWPSRLRPRVAAKPSYGQIVALAVTLGITFGIGHAPDLVQQYLAGARSWPEPYAEVPMFRIGKGFYGVYLPWPVALFLPALFLPDAPLVIGWRLLTAASLWWLARGRAVPFLVALTSPIGSC